MAVLTIKGVPGLDGVYETDFSYFTNREWRTIKEVAKVRMGEFQDALDATDNDLVVALTVIALQRHNIPVNVEVLWDAEAGKITLVDEDADAGPPAPTATAESGSGDAPGLSSAPPSNGTGAGGPETTRPATGPPPSDTGATSASRISTS